MFHLRLNGIRPKFTFFDVIKKNTLISNSPYFSDTNANVKKSTSERKKMNE
jgi:hypothetical protein